jgi:hypothetical protein
MTRNKTLQKRKFEPFFSLPTISISCFNLPFFCNRLRQQQRPQQHAASEERSESRWRTGKPDPGGTSDANCRSVTCRTWWFCSCIRSSIGSRFPSPTSPPPHPSIPSTCSSNSRNLRASTAIIPAGAQPTPKG